MAQFSPTRLHNLTYQEIVDQFSTACSEHLAINSFDTGTLDFLDANAVNKLYPYVYLRPIVSTGVVDKERSLTFEIYSMDVPKLSDESPIEVLSKTEMYIYGLIAYFVEGPANRQQSRIFFGSIRCGAAFSYGRHGGAVIISFKITWKKQTLTLDLGVKHGKSSLYDDTRR